MKTGIMEFYKIMFNIIVIFDCVKLRNANVDRSLCIQIDNKFNFQFAWSFFSSIEQVSIANALFSTNSFWQFSLTNVNVKHDHGNSLFDQFNSIHTIKNEVYQLYVTFCCAQNTYIDEDDKRSLVFSTLLDANDGSQIDISIQQDFESVFEITKFGALRSNVFRTSEIDLDFRLK